MLDDNGINYAADAFPAAHCMQSFHVSSSGCGASEVEHVSCMALGESHVIFTASAVRTQYAAF